MTACFILKSVNEKQIFWIHMPPFVTFAGEVGDMRRQTWNIRELKW